LLFFFSLEVFIIIVVSHTIGDNEIAKSSNDL